MYIVKCEVFDSEQGVGRYSNRCCTGDCHASGSLIPVTPLALDATPENRRLDWSLGIQGLVCCGRFEFVRSLSREWWINKGKEIGLWSGEEVERLLHKGSWHSRRGITYDSVNVAGGRTSRAGKASKVAVGESDCPGCGFEWSGDACDNCGYADRGED